MGKPVRPENLHATLVFIGGVDAQTRTRIEGLADRITVPPFVLRLEQLGFWRRAGLLWLGTAALPEALAKLVAELREGIAGYGVALDARPFLVHVTLIRKLRFARHTRAFRPIEWQVDRFALVESIAVALRSEYRVLRTWPLAGAGT